MGTKELYLPSSVRTGGVALPRQAESAVLQEQAELRAELEAVAGRLEYYNAELKLLDPDLSVVMAKPNTTNPDLKPGYHLVRMNPGSMAWVKPIEHADGTWRDLDSSVFDMAAEDDLWNDRVQRFKKEMRKKAEQARQRQVLRERQERAAEFDERWKSVNNTSILVSKAVA
jgi:hypothetical protein